MFFATHSLPPEVAACCEAFETFYLNKHTGRKVMWQTSMGSADLKANFNGRRHELSVSTYQMCILMLFNKGDSFCLDEIRQATQIPEQELRRHLMSLCTPKHKILKKSSKVGYLLNIATMIMHSSSLFTRLIYPWLLWLELCRVKASLMMTASPSTMSL